MKYIKTKPGEHGEYKAYINGVYVGRLRKFCCGIDYYPKNCDGLFSILKAKYKTKSLHNCIEFLSGLTLPKSHFHWNFSDKVLKDKEKLGDYQNRLLKLDEQCVK